MAGFCGGAATLAGAPAVLPRGTMGPTWWIGSTVVALRDPPRKAGPALMGPCGQAHVQTWGRLNVGPGQTVAI